MAATSDETIEVMNRVVAETMPKLFSLFSDEQWSSDEMPASLLSQMRLKPTEVITEIYANVERFVWETNWEVHSKDNYWSRNSAQKLSMFENLYLQMCEKGGLEDDPILMEDVNDAQNMLIPWVSSDTRPRLMLRGLVFFISLAFNTDTFEKILRYKDLPTLSGYVFNPDYAFGSVAQIIDLLVEHES